MNRWNAKPAEASGLLAPQSSEVGTINPSDGQHEHGVRNGSHVSFVGFKDEVLESAFSNMNPLVPVPLLEPDWQEKLDVNLFC